MFNEKRIKQLESTVSRLDRQTKQHIERLTATIEILKELRLIREHAVFDYMSYFSAEGADGFLDRIKALYDYLKLEPMTFYTPPQVKAVPIKKTSKKD